MGGQDDYLPAPFADEQILALLDSIPLPHPTSIRPLKVTAAFHIIYILSYNAEDIIPKLPKTAEKPKTSVYDLVLRISGDHVARIKTENESAIIYWVRQNTSIPVPDIISYDATVENPLNREFIIFNRCPGVAISDIYDDLSSTQLDIILNQLIEILTDLHTHEFHTIGGMAHCSDSPEKIVPGPVLDETFWFLPDIPLYFSNTKETLESLNISGPYPDYISFVTASVEKHMHVAESHPSLTFLRKYFTLLSDFLSGLPQHAEDLNNTPIRLAHKDLHFANILCDPVTTKITAILDWEFAGTVPFPCWDPARAFLWNARPGDESYKEKYRLRDRFAELCRDQKVDFMKDAEFTSLLQESMHMVMNLLRCIVTTVPKGRCLDLYPEWEASMVKELQKFV